MNTPRDIARVRRYVETTSVSHELALCILETAIAEGAAAGLSIAATIVDPTMNLVAFARADGTTPHSTETSRRKAQTSASTRRPTGWMNSELATSLPLGTGTTLTNILGGVPLVFDGNHIGGLGIAGGPPEQDAQIAQRVLAAIGADPVVE
ncbi:GlcG/HbpS family heme-binding protein [Humibacter ginsengisoli]